MRFLLDTNVISEFVKPQPHTGVREWLAGVREDDVFLSVVTIAELRYGIDRLPRGKRRERLEHWLQIDLRSRFADRVLAVDIKIADLCGRMMASSESLGRPMDARDAFLAATAETFALTLVTRNTSDFEAIVRVLLNPWK